MSIVTHQASKDVRLLQPVLITWAALNVALRAVVVAGTWTFVPGTDAATTLEVAFNTLLGLNVAGFVAVGVLVTQADPALGTNAFWLTRPVSLRVLLGSKTIVLALMLVVLPVTLDGVTMLAVGCRLNDAVAPLPGALVLQATWLLPVAAVAAITVTLPQFMVAAVAETVACLLVITAADLLWPDLRMLRGITLDAVLTIGLMVLSAAVLATAYGTRRARASIALACAAPFALCAVLLAWPAAEPGSAARPGVHPAVPRTRTVTLPLAPATSHRTTAGIVHVLSISPVKEGCEVSLRWVGPADPPRLSLYAIAAQTGDAVQLSWRRTGEPFLSRVVPVPQHVLVSVTSATFLPPAVFRPWDNRTTCDTWLNGARLLVTERE